ncbi:hypothetical protein ACFOHM_09430, partial [Microbaculum marinum]
MIAEPPAFADAMVRSAVASALAEVAPTPESDFASVAETHWQLAVRMGWTATMIAESNGGLGLGLGYVADVCEEAGRNLFCGPLLETAVLLPLVARETGALSDLLPGIVSGDVRAAYAEAGFDDHPAALSLSPVEHAAGATHVCHLEERAGSLRVAIIEADNAAFTDLQAMDPSASVARVDVADRSACLGFVLDAPAAERVLTALHVAVAADLLGVGEAALSRTVEHVRERRQFGQP